MAARCHILLAALAATAFIALPPAQADDEKVEASEPTPRFSVSVATKRRREAQLQAEDAWRELVERVPDLDAMALRQQPRSLQRVPKATEVASRRRYCQHERDPETNHIKRVCRSYLDPNP